MDAKIEIKEDPFSDVASQNDVAFFPKDVAMKTNNDSVILDNDYDTVIKTEIKSEALCREFDLQEERASFTSCAVTQTNSETHTCNNCQIEIKREIEEQSLLSDFGSQNVTEFLPEQPILKTDKNNSDHEMDNKVEIKDERWWLEAEVTSNCGDTKDEDFPPVNSPRLNTGTDSGDSAGKSPLPSAEASGKDSNSFSQLSHLKSHILIHAGKTPHKCEICAKSFRRLSGLRKHNLIHGDKPHKCEICDKRFTQLLYLKVHRGIHEGEKAHKCEICEMGFTLLSRLRRHILIHEGKRPHKCEVCDKSFSRLSDLKRHNLIHGGKKPHNCEICEKRFTQLSHLERHKLNHEGKKPHKCETCEKSFTLVSDLKRHTFIHEGKKPHKCEVCEKSFTLFSDLKRHNLIHEGKKPHKCKICERSFTWLSSLNLHKLIHVGKNPY